MIIVHCSVDSIALSLITLRGCGVATSPVAGAVVTVLTVTNFQSLVVKSTVVTKGSFVATAGAVVILKIIFTAMENE